MGELTILAYGTYDYRKEIIEVRTGPSARVSALSNVFLLRTVYHFLSIDDYRSKYGNYRTY